MWLGERTCPDQRPAGSVGGWWYRETSERPRRRLKAMSEPLHRTSRIGHRVPAFIAIPVALLALGFLIVLTAVAVLAPRTTAADPGHPTKGRIPEAAFLTNGMDAALVPDFVSVWNRDGTAVAGYVPKEDLVQPMPTFTASRSQGQVAPVYADDLTTLVGHMYPGRGFVPLGVDPNSIPTFPVRQGPAVLAPMGLPTSLTLYVRSAAPTTRWFGVVPASDTVGAMGATIPISVACLGVPLGGQAVMFDRPPQNAGAVMLRVIYQRVVADGWPTLWVDIATDGTVRQGTGMPSWWVGPPPPC
jgi:hypothetical protein